MPERVALGHHGNALWFADKSRGTYEDPAGGAPAGSVATLPIDLRQIVDSVLSFSSYYETEGLAPRRT